MELLEYFDEENTKAIGIAERDYIHKTIYGTEKLLFGF